MSCHGLENSKLSGKHASAMLANGHPLNQISRWLNTARGVRHLLSARRNNKQKNDQTRAGSFIRVGQAAALVSANRAVSKTDDSKFCDCAEGSH